MSSYLTYYFILLAHVTNSLLDKNSKCISHDTTIWCVTINSIMNLNTNQSSAIYPYFCDYDDYYYYYYYYLLTDKWPSNTHCFDGTNQVSSCINIARFGDNTASIIGQSNLYNFNKWNTNPQTISIPLSAIDSTAFVPRISITNYKSTSQCIEILSAQFPSNTQLLEHKTSYFFIRGHIARSNSNISSAKHVYSEANASAIMEISTSSHMINSTTLNELFCFAATSNHKYIHISLELVLILNINNAEYITYAVTNISIDSRKYIQESVHELHTKNTNTSINIRYWAHCDNNDNDDNVKQIKFISSTLSNLTFYFLLSISITTCITIIIVSILSQLFYPRGDPINYFALIWMLLELWDFWSDVSFTIYLFFISMYHSSSFMILTIISIICVLIPYILNIFYFQHLIRLWCKSGYCCKAPQIWLNNGYNYAYFLLITLLTGSVFPAIELTNSVLIPHRIFMMRVPYFELVRVRTERFITNVLFENLPFLALQIVFYRIIQTNASSVLQETVGNSFVFLATVLSSVLSILFSGTYYFSYRGKISVPIAIYRLNITLACVSCEDYWKFSIWRMQTAISKAFGVSSPALIVIDSCNITNNTISIHSRLLYDESPFGNRANIRLLLENRNVGIVARHITNLFDKEFASKEDNSLRCSMTSINEICGAEGELVYDYYNEGLVASLCCWICNQNRNDAYDTRDAIAMYQKKQVTHKKKKKQKKDHIRNVSDMKRAYSKNQRRAASTEAEPNVLRRSRHTTQHMQSRHIPKLSVQSMREKTASQSQEHHNHNLSVSKVRSYDKPLPLLVSTSPSTSVTSQIENKPLSMCAPTLTLVYHNNNNNNNKSQQNIIQTSDDGDEEEDIPLK